ncbi:F-type H+-transporting ATPase subunit delta [Microbacterium halimionae]|uniref:ATP synthase subunit delta n=1 Tax=Microbacterium halimionae TaxID=1526413 RepID=A0A7W3PLT8_9MICO|nr:F0F1 ATP synthase subunit delta [Microbacterium halimionae]MBA8816523.1 F-type H+-transporting ATPase subunit delta [Microbacterium halimionae]NII95290.1 F-type H+-transporting ATPase subunit delta [Microbacterium halimionae]
MGSATTHALAATSAALDAASGVDLDVATQLFTAARTLADSVQLRSALADGAAAPSARTAVINAVFAKEFAPSAVSLLNAAVEQRWSSDADLVAGIEELAVRAAVVADPSTDVEGELFWFSRIVADNPELELALGSRLGDASAKGTLVESLVDGKVSAATSLIISSIVRQPGERRVRAILTQALDIAARQRGRTVATVTTAHDLGASQIDRLRSALSARYRTDVSINVVIDAAVVGGLRVAIGDELIDASVSTRLADLRQRLAG